jgi:hypothetical protein
VGYTLAGVPNRLGRGALIEAWNGSRWSAQPTPPLAGEIELRGVFCTSVNNCVAVGWQSPLVNPINGQPLIERWNGANWAIDQQPGPLSAVCGTECAFFSRTLAGVACGLASACEAVGSTDSLQSTTTFAESWNGTSWATTPTANPAPAPPYDKLTAVACTTRTACVAVGSGQNKVFAERWDGKGWSVHGTSRGSAATPNGISCISSSRCEIVGFGPESSNNGTTRPQAWLWNGLSWAAQNPPGLPSASLESVACPTVSDCFAAGATSTDSGPTTFPLSAPLIERFG